MKVCIKCNVDKPETEYHKDKSRKDGYDPRCKACRYHRKVPVQTPEQKKAIAKAYRQANQERYNELAREWRKANPDKTYSDTKKAWRDANPERVRLTYRRNHYKLFYNLSDESFAALGNHCVGCGTELVTDWSSADYNAEIDHDHECCDSRFSCGQCVRGIICRSCNIKRRRAAKLRRHEERNLR